jgi:MFS transporter, FHS family, Na+ dependent glucose transporter 1
VLFFLGVFGGIVDVGGNTLLVWVHGEHVGPYMNAMHFFFGVGAALSPLIVAKTVSLTGDIIWAYWVLSLLMLPVAVMLLRSPSPPAPDESSHEAGDGRAGRVRRAPMLVIFVAMFYFLYVGAEGSFGGWIATYAEVMGFGDAATAAYLTSVFWGALTLGRLISIPLTARFRPRQVLTADLLGCVFSVGALMLWPSVPWVVWAGTFGAGFAMASIFPTMLSLAERRMMITGKITGWFFVGGSLGGMSLPWLIGQLFEEVGPRVTIFAIFTNVVVASLAFAGLLTVFRRPPPMGEG